jgi:hypothetical protein
MKKMIIAIVVLAAVAFTTHLVLQAKEGKTEKLKPEAALVVEVDAQGYVIDAHYKQTNNHDLTELINNCVLAERPKPVREKPEFKMPDDMVKKPVCVPCSPCISPCYFKLCAGGYWKCSQP